MANQTDRQRHLGTDSLGLLVGVVAVLALQLLDLGAFCASLLERMAGQAMRPDGAQIRHSCKRTKNADAVSINRQRY